LAALIFDVLDGCIARWRQSSPPWEESSRLEVGAPGMLVWLH
jgi:hypothetical protein